MKKAIIKKFANKEETRAMRFIQSAASSDESRPILTGLHVSNGQTVAADGFRLHIGPTPDTLKECEGKTLAPQSRIYVNPRPQELQPIEGTFPDYEQIMPKGEPNLTIALDKDFLGDLKDMPTFNNKLMLEFRTPTSPVVVRSRDDNLDDYTALIMPAHIDDRETVDKRADLEKENKALRKANESNQEELERVRKLNEVLTKKNEVLERMTE